VRHKFELIFLEVSAKNKALFFKKSLWEQNITPPLMGDYNAYGSYRNSGSSLGILKFFANVHAGYVTIVGYTKFKEKTAACRTYNHR